MNNKKSKSNKNQISLEKQQKKEHKERTETIVRRILIVIIILLLLILAFKCGYHQVKPSKDGNAVIGQLDGKTKEEIQQEIDRAVADSSLVISINAKIEMKDGASPAPVRIENVPNNNYIIQVTIKLKNTGYKLYESGMIEPNYHISEVKFAKKLLKGTYEAQAIFSAYTLDKQEYVGQQKADITIIVNK